MIPKRIDSFQVEIAEETKEHCRVNFETCGFCGKYDATIQCECGATIIHKKDTARVGHFCAACQCPEDREGIGFADEGPSQGCWPVGPINEDGDA